MASKSSSPQQARSVGLPVGAGLPVWVTTVALFMTALVARLVFARAGPDAGWPYSVFYQGDALVWLDQVLAARRGVSLEAGLPLRPPATAWLIDLLWDGTPAGVRALKTWWCVIGAASVAAFQLALIRPFGRTVAGIAAGALALGASGLVTSASLNNEAPYLLLALISMALIRSSAVRPGRLVLLAWGATNALACLFRAEHVLVFAAIAAYLAWCAWKPLGRRAALAQAGLAVAAFVVALVPWHIEAWSRVATMNRGEQPRDPAADRAIAQIEARAAVSWTPAARAAAEELPAFLRRSASAFVALTVARRGGETVRVEDLEVLREAYGVWPDEVAAHPFIASYGPLNFFLANAAGADGGFDRAPLERPPPLAGGSARYPAEIVSGMPPSRLSFEYPPHLHVFNHGYAAGLREIMADPTGWLRVCASKLAHAWRGASLGFTGLHLPGGTHGTRRAVDLFTPTGFIASTWRVVLGVLCIAGLYAAWRRTEWRAALVPWLLYSACRLAIVLAFYGYARQGVLVEPVVLLLAALAVTTWIVPRLGSRAPQVGGALLLLGLALEAGRAWSAPRAELDGVDVRSADPFDPAGPLHPRRHDDRSLSVD